MREPVSSVDTALLRLESPTNLMVVTGVLILGKPIEFDRLRATLEARLLAFDRFRQRVVYLGRELATPYWEDDPCLDLDYHVQRAVLPPPGDEAALQQVVSGMISVPLDPNRPLWQFHLVESYGQGCAVICRVHHSVGDGQALVHVIESLTDAQADAPLPAPPAPRPAAIVWDRSKEARPMLARLGIGRGRVRRLVRRGVRLAAHPQRALEVAETAVQAAREIGGLALSTAEPDTVLRGKLGIAKRAAWSAAIPLDGVKTIGRRLGGTVNDVLVAAVTGGLRRYLLARGESVEGAGLPELHAAIPVSLRRPGSEASLGNQVGAVLLDLPVGLADPGERLRVIRRRMELHKNSLEAPVILAGLKVLGALPMAVEGPVTDYFSSRLSAVMTNVVGPRDRMYLAGAPVEALLAWVPKTGGIGLGVSLYSYAGEVRVGILSDEGLVPDPEAIVAGCRAELDVLLALAEEAGEPVTLRASLARLEDVLAGLETALDGRKAAPDPAAGDEAAHCQAVTRSGAPCRNRPLPGSRTCRVHQATGNRT